jgi:uncharacterized protein YjbJ (UPF0337 family)
VEGKIEDIKGRVKRQVGEWTGDDKSQAEGTVDQAKGKTQNAWGKIKDAGREAADKIKDGDRRDEELGRDKDLDEGAA